MSDRPQVLVVADRELDDETRTLRSYDVTNGATTYRIIFAAESFVEGRPADELFLPPAACDNRR